MAAHAAVKNPTYEVYQPPPPTNPCPTGSNEQRHISQEAQRTLKPPAHQLTIYTPQPILPTNRNVSERTPVVSIPISHWQKSEADI